MLVSAVFSNGKESRIEHTLNSAVVTLSFNIGRLTACVFDVSFWKKKAFENVGTYLYSIIHENLIIHLQRLFDFNFE